MLDKTRWGTWDEWKVEGYRVLKGEKATFKNGIPMFSEYQVIKLEQKSKRTYDTRAWQHDEDWDELDTWVLNEYY